MSDFSNYIRVAIQGLSENTPLARASAYERVRKGIRRQLESRAASEAEVADTLEELENAILDMEAEQLMHPTSASEPAAPAKPQEPVTPKPQETAAPVSRPESQDAAAPAYRPESNVTPIVRRPSDPPVREYAFPKITEAPSAPSGRGADAPRAPETPAEPAPPPVPAAPAPSYSPPPRAAASGASVTQALKVEENDRDLLEEFQSALTAELSLPISAEEEARSKPKPEAPAIEESTPVHAEEPEAVEPAGENGFDVRILLRKAVSNEDMRDPATREIIYRRARNALVKYLKSLSPQPDFDAVHTHIEKLNAAIREVEAEQAERNAGKEDADTGPTTDELMTELADIWSADFEEPGAEEPRPQPRRAKPSKPVAQEMHRTIADEVEEAVQELSDTDFEPHPFDPAPQPGRSIDEEVEDAVQELIAADTVRQQPSRKAVAPRKPERRKAPPAPVAPPPAEDFELDEDFAAPSNAQAQKQSDRWATDDGFDLPDDIFGDDFDFEEPAERVAANQDHAPKAKPRRRGGFGRVLLILLVLLIGGGVAAAVAFPDATARYTAKARTTGTWLVEFVAGLAGEPSSSARVEGETDTAASATDANTQQAEPASAAQIPPSDAESAPSGETATEAASVAEENTQAPAVEQAVAPLSGEKAFLFATAGGQAVDTGNVEWSVIESSPLPGLPPEPAIRGDVSIPADGLRATLTLRRNLDETLPATHLFELVFAPSDSVASSEIASVEGITFVRSGQDRAEPLVGSVVKIADNIFLFALADVPAARQLHQQLFSEPDQIEIQFVYYSGRRTTLRLVTGETGREAFQTATAAWGDEAAPAPAPAPAAVQQEPMTPPETTALESPAEPEAVVAEPEAPADDAQTEASTAQTGRPVIPDNVPIPPDRPLFDG